MTAVTRMDVADIVDLGDAEAVMVEVRSILAHSWPETDWGALAPLEGLFLQLYEGRHPEYLGCEVGYHNGEHVLDVTLAMARLLAGRELRWGSAWSLGPDLALAGVASALLHDSGYLRRRADRRYSTGGAYTRTHVQRGAALMVSQLPAVGLEAIAPLCARLIHFTNCNRNPATVRSASAYLSRDDLMRRTPNFIHRVAGPRIERDFAGAYHYASVWFGGRNLYLDAIVENCERLNDLLAQPQSA